MRTRRARRLIRQIRAVVNYSRPDFDIDVYEPLGHGLATRLVDREQHRSEASAQLAEERRRRARRRHAKRLADKLDKALEHQRQINNRQERKGTGA